MNNKKRNTIITCIIIGLLLISSTIFFLLNHSMTDNGLSVLEKKWLTDHVNQIIDIKVYNDVPIYGYNGNGIIFDFLDSFTEKNKVSFNKISYYAKQSKEKDDFGFMILNSNEKIQEKDILLDTDHYVILEKEKEERISWDNVKKIGMLESDSTIIKNYFKYIKYIEYKDVNTLIEGIEKEEVNYVTLPLTEYMDKILENKLNIVSHLEDLEKKYILRTKDKTIYEIMRKSYMDYKEKSFTEDYSKNYLSTFFNATSTNDIGRKNYNSKVYHYGYVTNMPFENTIKNDFVGTLSNYLANFEKISSSEIDIIKYNSIDDLKSALVSNEVDFTLSNFDYQNLNLKYVTTNTIRDLEYVVLSKKKIIINSIQGLKNEKVSVVATSRLNDLCKEYEIPTILYADTDTLLRSLDDESIVLLDKETLEYYKNNKLENYQVITSGIIKDAYKFIMNSSNETFNNLFKYFVESTSYNTYKYEYNTNIDLNKDDTTLKLFIFIIILIVVLIVSVLFMNRKNVVQTVTKKEDRLKYIDPMTSLKNRNYLNKNIYTWDENVIFPQAIIVFDIDHLQKINDKFGREAGDEIIKKAASILINNQLENTDIVRSDGDEFIIYMVGFDEKEVAEYMKKIQKSMKDIPKNLGVQAGYSMIFDEVKTVDDAINEAISMMMKNKE